MVQQSKSGAGQAPASESPAKMQEILHREEMLDEALEETFPASDPISVADLARKIDKKP